METTETKDACTLLKTADLVTEVGAKPSECSFTVISCLKARETPSGMSPAVDTLAVGCACIIMPPSGMLPGVSGWMGSLIY